jgi:hypothetical protein
MKTELHRPTIGVLLVACALAGLSGCATAPSVSGPPLGPRRPMAFPAKVAAFTRHGPAGKDQRGYPEATYWAGALAMASVFYYQDEQHSLAHEFAGCRDAVKMAWTSATLLSDGRRSIVVGGRKRDGYHAMFVVRQGAAPEMKSQLFIFADGDYFLVFRITYPKPHADRAELEITKFLAEMPWPGAG